MIRTACLVTSFAVLAASIARAQTAPAPRVEILPLANHQASFRIAGQQITRWHFGKQYPRPFFFPLNGPSGESLTRMGHPGAPNHDHHRSVWLAHHDVAGVDFWGDGAGAAVRQKQWYAYVDGDNEGIMAVALGWYDREGGELMSQDLIAALRPLPDGELALEIQTTFRPAGKAESVRLGKTNFGFLAVRVAKSLSVHFGGGAITSSEGRRGEAEIFGQPARWMDYSGPITSGAGENRKTDIAGITYFDHPANPRYPSRWHVREDGWMGASFCREDAYTITADEPLTLRYLLHTHNSDYNADRATAMHKAFTARKSLVITKSARPHQQFDVKRE